MWGLVYTALSFLATLSPRGVRRISAISCLDLSTTGKSDFLRRRFSRFFLITARYFSILLITPTLPFLLDSFIEARKLFERVKTSRKIIPLPPLTQPYIKSLASLLSLFGTTTKSYAQQKQMKHDSQNGCGFNCSPLTSLLLHFIQFICFIVQDIIHFWGRPTAFGGQAPAIHTNLN